MPAFSPLTDSSVASQLPEGLTVLSFLIAASLTMAATTTRPSTQVANFGTSPKPSQTQAGASGICNLPISEERMAVTSAHREEKEAEAKLDHPEESEIDEVHSARPPRDLRWATRRSNTRTRKASGTSRADRDRGCRCRLQEFSASLHG